LCGFFWKKRLLALSVGLVAFSLALRISSTTAFIGLFATAVIVVYRLRYHRLFRAACVSIAGMMVLGNLAVFMSKDVAEGLYSIEPLMKEEALESKSNNGFRLGIISAVRDDIGERSILLGKFFSGDVTVDARKYYPDQAVKYAPIHSEYIIMLQQGGLIGYGLLTGLFVGMAFFWARAARFAHAAGDAVSGTLFDAVQAINLTYMLCVTGNPMLDEPKMTVPYLALISLTIFLARARSGFAGRHYWAAADYPRPSRVRRTFRA
jgi:hypothetical protein